MTIWRKPTADAVFTADETTARLADELPKWYFEDGWIRTSLKPTAGRAR